MGNAININLFGKFIDLSWEQHELLKEIIAELLDVWEKTVAPVSQYKGQLFIEIKHIKRMQECLVSKQTNRDDSIDIPATAVQNFVGAFDRISQTVGDDTTKYNEEWPRIKSELVQYLEKVKEEGCHNV